MQSRLRGIRIFQALVPRVKSSHLKAQNLPPIFVKNHRFSARLFDPAAQLRLRPTDSRAMSGVTVKSDGLQWNRRCSSEDLQKAALGKNVVVVGGTKVIMTLVTARLAESAHQYLTFPMAGPGPGYSRKPAEAWCKGGSTGTHLREDGRNQLELHIHRPQVLSLKCESRSLPSF
jgi:hypothetical protein